MKIYIDSDILIWHLRGKREALAFLKQIIHDAENELTIGAMQRAEIVFFMRPEEERSTLELLQLFRTESVSGQVVDLAGTYYRRYKASHSIDINDAILAATCALSGGKIYTLNKKHYPMRDIVVERAW